MASATGIPEERPASVSDAGEDEPLLGRPGDVIQQGGRHILVNLITGTATLAQAGIWIIVAAVWYGIFSHKLIFFSPHPLLNSTGVLLTTQAILILQPTHTPSQKRQGSWAHFSLMLTAIVAFVAALTIIEINKASHPQTRFRSVHGIMGLTTYILVMLQVAVGVAQYFLPVQIFGSVGRGKKVYRWHRMGGYLLLLLELATIAAATQTYFNRKMLHIRLLAILVGAVLVVLGVGARIKKRKLGII